MATQLLSIPLGSSPRPNRMIHPNRRGLSFCYSLIVLGSMLTLGIVFMQIGLNSAHWAYSHCRDQQALSLAEGAVDHAIWMMQQSSAGESGINTALGISDGEITGGTFHSPVFQLPTGRYQFIATAPYNGIPGTVEVHGWGIAKDGTRDDVSAILRLDTTSSESPLPYKPHPIFHYAMFSDHNLTVNGSPQIIAHSESGGAGLFSNGNITFKGTASTVYGAIVAGGHIYGTATQIPSNAPRIEEHPHIDMPVLDLDYYRDPTHFAAHEYHVAPKSGLSFTNGHNAGSTTFAEPKVIFVEGSVKIAGNWEGVGLLVATEGIQVSGNVTYGSPDSSWAFLTSGQFKISGTAQIHGLIYCHNADGHAEFIGTGTPNIFGGVIADVITMRGDYTTEWDGTPCGISALPGTTWQQGPPLIETVLWEKL
ncbi:MAG: hypothetical protein ACUVX8_00915 [Candidatus Zipacnadales bacterium]